MSLNRPERCIPYIPEGSSVTARFNGSFCEAVVKSVNRQIKLKVVYVGDDGDEEVAVVEESNVFDPIEFNQEVNFIKGTRSFRGKITKILDQSTYKVFTVNDCFNLKEKVTIKHSCPGTWGCRVLYSYDENTILVSDPYHIHPKRNCFDGAVYKVNLSSKVVTEFTKFPTINKYNSSGAAMGLNIKRLTRKNSYMICAPNAINYPHVTIEKIYSGHISDREGVCYEVDKTGWLTTMFYQHIGQEINKCFGFDYAESTDSIFISMPFHYRGTGMIQKFFGGGIKFPYSTEMKGIMYSGFAMTIAHVTLGQKESIIASLPASKDNKGSFAIFQLDGHATKKVENIITEVGSGYGFSLIRINNEAINKRDYIVVGAPFSMNEGKETGAIIIYDSNQNYKILFTFRGDEPYGLMGYSLLSPGDLDGNTYEDFLVGVPRGGSDHKGAIYVFSHTVDDFILSQKIYASNLNLHSCVEFFGIHMDSKYENSKNKNKGTRILVGSKGSVVEFESLDVLIIKVKLEQKQQIDLPCKTVDVSNYTCKFLQNLCVSLIRLKVQSIKEIKVDVKLNIWNDAVGAEFGTNKTNSTVSGKSISGKINFPTNMTKNHVCIDVHMTTKNLEPNSKDLTLAVKVANATIMRQNGYSLSPISKLEDNITIKINSVCPQDSCTPEYKINLTYSPESIIQGTSSSIQLVIEINVTNWRLVDGKFNINYTEGLEANFKCEWLKSVGSTKFCSFNLLKVIEINKMYRFSIYFTTKDISSETTELEISLSFTGFDFKNLALEKVDNNILIPVKKIFKLSMSVSPQYQSIDLNKIFLNESQSNQNDMVFEKSIKLKVYNRGPSESPKFIIKISNLYQINFNLTILQNCIKNLENDEIICLFPGLESKEDVIILLSYNIVILSEGQQIFQEQQDLKITFSVHTNTTSDLNHSSHETNDVKFVVKIIPLVSSENKSSKSWIWALLIAAFILIPVSILFIQKQKRRGRPQGMQPL